ncbi:MAG: glycosyltransferase [Burkholderiaceae bacterium]|nr:glycosyltransferase [Burkholderiaceae bacterium]
MFGLLQFGIEAFFLNFMKTTEKSLHDIFTKPLQNYVCTGDQVSTDLKGLKIAFLVWSLDISGGTNVILQHCDYLIENGATVTIIKFLSQEVSDWHPSLKKIKVIDVANLDIGESFDIGVVTWWRSFFEMDKVRARSWTYFIQSIESRFYLGTTPQYSPLVASTYDIDIPVITISRWLQTYLAFEHGRPSFLVKNGVDKNVFSLIGEKLLKKPEKKVRFLVEGPLNVDFKQTELALDVLQHYRDKVEVWFLTSSHIKSTEKADKTFSQVPISSVGAIMRSCDVLLKLSLVEGMFGPPLEMFHCGGTAISGRVTGCDEYMINNYNSLLVNDATDSRQIKLKIEKIIDSPELLRKLKDAAVSTAALWSNWEKSSFEFATVLLLIHRNHKSSTMSHFIEAKAQLKIIDQGGI